jgi:hypothetical protein
MTVDDEVVVVVERKKPVDACKDLERQRYSFEKKSRCVTKQQQTSILLIVTHLEPVETMSISHSNISPCS